jgi:hypothetical protein
MSRRVAFFGLVTITLAGGIWLTGRNRGWWHQDSQNGLMPGLPVSAETARPAFWGRTADLQTLEHLHKRAFDSGATCPLAIIEAICDQDAGTRRWARNGVANFERRIPPDATPVLVSATAHPDRETRLFALSRLSRDTGDPQTTLNAILHSLKDTDPAVRDRAYSAHLRVTGKLDLALPYWVRLWDDEEAEWPIEGENEETRKLKLADRNQARQTVANAFISASQVRAQEVAKILVNLLDDPSARVSTAAAAAIGQWAPPHPLTLLPECAKLRAAERIRRLGTEVSVPAYRDRVSRAMVRFEAAILRSGIDFTAWLSAGWGGLTCPWWQALYLYSISEGGARTIP